MESFTKPAINTQLNPGELEELWLEFQEFQDLVPQEVDREPSETCAEKVECSLPSTPGGDGTERPTRTKRDTPLPLLWLLLVLLP